MVDIPIDDVASIGVIHDIPGHDLPPEAWTTGLNVRCIDGGVEWLGGKTQVFGTPNVAPHFALPIRDATNVYWLYVDLVSAHVYDGSAHSDITRLSGPYTATETRQWNGTLFSGIPILNNGIDLPQYWDVSLTAGTPLVDLPNFGTNTARVMRAFGPYLVAFDVTIGGTRFPHAVLWSHPADPGSLPVSWDYTDPTRDAGLNDLPDVHAGIIKDALPLRGSMMIYKEGSTWKMTPITGGYIFDFKTYLETSGILTARCVTLTPKGDAHFVATQDDIILHDGQGNPKSLLDKRMKRYIHNSFDSTNFINSFCFTHQEKAECWFCYPESGNVNPNMAVIWNSVDGTLTEAEVDFRNANIGPVSSSAVVSPSWSSVVPTWSADVDTWNTAIAEGELSQRLTVVCNTDDTKFLRLDQGTTNDGTAVLGTVQRTGLSLAGRKRTGEWIVDFHQRKFLHRVRVKLYGGPVDVRVGFQELVGGPIEWSPVQSFDPATMLWVDFAGCGQAVAIEFSGPTAWRLEGYVPEVEVIGEF